MKKKNLNPLDFIKTYWVLIAILGFLITFSAKISAVWKSPEEIQQTQEELDVTQQAIGNLSTNLNVYTNANEAANKQRDEQIKMWAQYLMEQNKRRR